jgi:predicted O-linked N-acetylglucosamine transferase (SPINDLY family)
VQGSATTTTLEEGLRHHRAGRIEEAAKSYRQILTTDPRQPDALHLLGCVAQSVGQFDEAVELISESLRVNPDNVSAINNLASVLKDQGRYPEAIDFYEAAIAAAPAEAYIRSNLGNALRDMGRLEEAAACHRQALEIEPESYAALSNLGSVLDAQGDTREATACFRRALKLNPDSYETHVNLGVTLKREGRLAEAEESLRRALDLQPRSDAALANLGSLMLQQGRTAEAFVTLELALTVNPRSVVALINMGNVLKDLGRFDAARECLEKAVQLAPKSHLAHNNLGTVLNELGRAAEAAACFRRALELNPDYHWAHSNLLFTLQYLPGVDRDALFAEHCRYDEKYARRFLADAAPHRNSRDPERRIRIGYVSGDLREHSVAFFIEPVLAGHDRQQFEVFCYANQVGHDAVTQRLRSHVEHWREVASLDDDALADRIRRDGIDILVDLSGHTARHRLLTFARKPAPVQVTMVGYMHTTGLRAMDYRISDPRLDPPGETERFHTEELIRLEAGAATFRPPAACPEVNALPALTNGHVTFGAFNNPAKITAETIAAWAEILRALPESRLLAVGRSGNAIKPQLEAHGIDGARVETFERQPLLDYLALHHRCDLLLDSFPYNGGTTSLFAIWMGVPLTTLDGGTSTSRAGGALLRPLGLHAFVASDRADYVRRAIAAASDLPHLAALRPTLRARLAPHLGDGTAFTTQLEAAFRDVWRRWCGKSS